MMLVEEAPGVRPRAEASSPSAATVSVVIPALNEERCIAWVLERLPEIVGEVILVDGRSTDRTIDIARAIRPDLKVVLEEAPGKGAALRAGFAAATGDYIVMLDADGSMDPDEIERFVDALHDGLEFVKGSRFAQGGGTSDMSVVRRLGNGALRGAVNRLYRTNLSDLCYGFIAFRRDRLSNLRSPVRRLRDRDGDDCPGGDGEPADRRSRQLRVPATVRQVEPARMAGRQARAAHAAAGAARPPRDAVPACAGARCAGRSTSRLRQVRRSRGSGRYGERDEGHRRRPCPSLPARIRSGGGTTSSPPSGQRARRPSHRPRSSC